MNKGQAMHPAHRGYWRPALPGLLALTLPALALAQADVLQKKSPLDDGGTRPPLLKFDADRSTEVYTGYTPNHSWIVKDNVSAAPATSNGGDSVPPTALFGTVYSPDAVNNAQDPEQRQWNPVVRMQHRFNAWKEDWYPFIGAGGTYRWMADGGSALSQSPAAGSTAADRIRIGSVWATVFEAGLRYRMSHRADLVFAGQFAPYRTSTVLHLQSADGSRLGESTANMAMDGVIGVTAIHWYLGS